MPEDPEEYIQLRILKVTQPIGNFYVGVAKGIDVARVARADIRRMKFPQVSDSADQSFAEYVGIQRELNGKRVAEIQSFVRTHDATFPTGIILAVSEEDVKVDGEILSIRNRVGAATVIDGQHRLAGFVDGAPNDFEVIVTLFVDMSKEMQAFVFSTINTKHTRINPSLAADLLSFSRLETPEKVAHNLARKFHEEPDGPWHGRIKILGRKDELSEGIIT